jgi:hypothetical protein
MWGIVNGRNTTCSGVVAQQKRGARLFAVALEMWVRAQDVCEWERGIKAGPRAQYAAT